MLSLSLVVMHCQLINLVNHNFTSGLVFFCYFGFLFIFYQHAILLADVTDRDFFKSLPVMSCLIVSRKKEKGSNNHKLIDWIYKNIGTLVCHNTFSSENTVNLLIIDTFTHF